MVIAPQDGLHSWYWNWPFDAFGIDLQIEAA